MALPPEPLSDVLPAAATVVVAEVVSVDDLAPWPRGSAPLDGAPDRPAQRVQLTGRVRGSGARRLAVDFRRW